MQTEDCDGKDRGGGGDHKAPLRQKKLKAKSLKWGASNRDKMNSKVVETGGSDGVYDDKVVCSLTAATFSSLISRKRVRTLGKVAEHCDAVDPPVPRKLRSAINKRVGRFVSASSRHVKKRRHLSAISAQISFVDQQTRLGETPVFTEEEEEIADVLLSLSQTRSICKISADNAVADSSNVNVASTSCSEGAATKEGDRVSTLPSAANELGSQAACVDKLVEQTDSIPSTSPVPRATDQPNNVDQPLSENGEVQALHMGIVASLPSPSKGSFDNSAPKQLKVQSDETQSYPAQKPEVPLWLEYSNKHDSLNHEKEYTKSNSSQETMPPVQTPLSSAPDGYLIKPSSKLVARTNTTSETSKVTASGNHDQLSMTNSVIPTKGWKRSITHVYVSRLIQMRLNEEKASEKIQVRSEEKPHTHSSKAPTGSTLHKSKAQDETFYTVHFDVRLPVQPSTGICDMSAAGPQKMVSGSNFLNLPASTGLPGGATHVQYLHPQIAPRGAMPYPFQHLPYSRGNSVPAAAIQQQMQQFVMSSGYAPRPGLPASSSPMMKLQQLIPSTHQHQQQPQQQMWQFHVPQYHQARQDAAGAPAAAWHAMSSSSLRPVPMISPHPQPAMPPQMELFCAPYQGGGGGRQPQQLRLI